MRILSVLLILGHISRSRSDSLAGAELEEEILRKKDGLIKESERLLSPETINADPFARFGRLGVNYDLDSKRRPFIFCEVYDRTKCHANEKRLECGSERRCYVDDLKSHQPRCMAALVFRNDFGDVPPQLRNESFLITESKLSEFGVLKSSTTGCWSQHESELRNCGTSGTCTMKRTVRSGGDGLQFVMFCCCDTHNCNRNWTHEPEIEEVGMLSTPMPQLSATTNSSDIPLSYHEWLIFLPLVEIFILLCFCFICALVVHFSPKDSCIGRLALQLRAELKDNGQPSMAAMPKTSEAIALLEREENAVPYIEVHEKISEGRFGEVYFCSCQSNVIAAKIFSTNNRQSWLNEKRIFDELEQFNFHASQKFVVKYMGGFVKDEKLWILTEYCGNGSLHDYLKCGNVVSLEVMGKLACTMLCGVSFLHGDCRAPPYYGQGKAKPSIAHRDLKSRNILIRSDMTACVADFGLAMRNFGEFKQNEVYAQVGTTRYMSPEVLQGAIDFSWAAFLQIDVYATALILWELLSRTWIPEAGEMDLDAPYQLPYEAELGKTPALAELQEQVAQRGLRPTFRKSLFLNKVAGEVAKTINDMWEKEPGARISSSCAWERLDQLYKCLRETCNP